MSFLDSLFGKNKSKPLEGDLRERVEQVIASAYIDPYIGIDLVAAKAIKQLSQSRDALQVYVELPYPAQKVGATLADNLTEALQHLTEFSQIDINVDWQIPAHQGQREEVRRIKNIIAISSAKGGVGKSTTTTNLALALAAQGASVGILDADLYGPSQPMLLGIAEGTTPQTRDMRYYAPIVAHGIKVMSMGLMVTEKTPLMWRGPVASETIQLLTLQTLWGDLDYLLIDMPPGTGDIHISLSQFLTIAGAVVVTTPQDIALLDVEKGIEMFTKVGIPILGVIENMSSHICSECGQEDLVFGSDGGSRIAKKFDTELLGSLPLNIHIRQQGDVGVPIVLKDPDDDLSKRYRDIALRMVVNITQPGLIVPLPNIRFVND
jgi:ATP-binding protein involved in chromosome partitioning